MNATDDKKPFDEARRETVLRCTTMFGDFIFRHECQSFCDAYVVALKILGEDARSQWTSADVIDAVLRASEQVVKH